MGLLGCNHPLLLSSYRYECIKPNKERTERLNKLLCNNKHPWLDHPLFATSFREEFANSMNPVILQKSKSTEGASCSLGAGSGRIKLTNISPLQRTNARYDFMTSKPAGKSCLTSGTRVVTPNHENMHTAYRYETRMTEKQQPVLQTEDFKTNYSNPILRTSFRYEYVPPRPPGASVKPVADPVHQRYACHRHGVAGAP